MEQENGNGTSIVNNDQDAPAVAACLLSVHLISTRLGGRGENALSPRSVPTQFCAWTFSSRPQSPLLELSDPQREPPAEETRVHWKRNSGEVERERGGRNDVVVSGRDKYFRFCMTS